MNKKNIRRSARSALVEAILNSTMKIFNISSLSDEAKIMVRRFIYKMIAAVKLSERGTRAICTELNNRYNLIQLIQAELDYNEKLTDFDKKIKSEELRYNRECYENIKFLAHDLGYRIEILETCTSDRFKHRLRSEGFSGIDLR